MEGALGPNAQNFCGVQFSFALHLILGEKLHICGFDDLFCSSNSLFNPVTFGICKLRGLI